MYKFCIAIAAVVWLSVFSAGSYAQGADLAAAGLQSLIEKLELSEQQRQEVESLIATYRNNTADIREKVTALQKEMKDVSLAKLDDQKIQQLSASTGRYSAQFTEQTLRLQAGFYAVLNDKQRKEFDAMRAEIAQRREAANTLP